ncbi:hypothetical protein SAMN05421776_12146 [Nocardia farcinica]|uniref:Uncharacterized protein n=1 Tax=Nocardia farcinica TaxID=37329 RepID=A0A0H5P9X3_NOCFR|nr:hypothetical protein [Nocardia farcinica]AXK88556.1 hypothetical protein DXT66_25695 [Nocardia farcinica]PFW98859.1 hypothetical protein CJ469_05820 [Nocardia farcinica]PFX04465.1 hypothetical protein CJ468_05441 [Nocardia farcinica]CRY84233.1 Uncharacterised protein [Nocardia farcinica]SIT34106.1 hypothetical protein SAMN05421776_12146 [Nocardia farcinica]
MSVNYYARTAETPADDEGLHIGQYVGGTEFLFRGHRDLGLTTVQAWRDYLTRDDVTIVAESGYEVDFRDFWPDAVARPAHVDFIMTPRWPSSELPSDRRWRDVGGHPFFGAEFC